MSIIKNISFFLFQTFAFFATCWLFVLCLYPLIILMILKKLLTKGHDVEKKDNQEITVGIFHPYCNAGAGGERVLWTVVKALQTNYKNVHVFIYTGDLDHDRETILANVEKVFDMKMQGNINIVYLHRRKWVEAKMYPFCTLLGQSIGSIWLGWEALTLFKPDIYIDTMGYAFTYPLFKYFGKCKVASYTHYPIISTDMLNRVSQRSASYNNRHVIARNPVLTVLKLGYYKGVAFLYGLAGKTSDIIMVNSSWTKEHINSIWKCPERTHLLGRRLLSLSLVTSRCRFLIVTSEPRKKTANFAAHTIVFIACSIILKLPLCCVKCLVRVAAQTHTYKLHVYRSAVIRGQQFDFE